MSQFSTDELSFVEGLPKHVEIECPVCLSILADPHMVSCCGHNFCESCIERVKASNGPCPMCKEMSFQAMVNKGHLRIINGLQVYCNNKEKGCQWKGALKNLSTHLNKGKREGECQYEVAMCRYEKCEAIGQRQHLKHHEDNECLQRPFECQYCYTKGTYHSITEEHYQMCLQYPVLCPNKCTLTQMPRGSITGHVDKECPLQPVDCVFSWAGCKERPLRKDIELHTTDTKHMMILAVACGELKKENEKVKQEMASVRVELKKENDKIKEELGKVKEENKRIKANIHRVIANDSYQVLPITITPESGVIHFYTDVCGHHMSARLSTFEVIGQGKEVLSVSLSLLVAFHEGVYDRYKPKLPKVFAEYEGKTIPVIKDTETNKYKQVHCDILERGTAPGVIMRDIITLNYIPSFINVRIYTT